MGVESRGNHHHVATRQKIFEMRRDRDLALSLGDIPLVRVLWEYEQIRSQPLGGKIAVVNSGHYVLDRTYREFQVGKLQYAVSISHLGKKYST